MASYCNVVAIAAAATAAAVVVVVLVLVEDGVDEHNGTIRNGSTNK